ncbi:hypothetical protein ACSBR1_008375 [Camellia fascicularis]
MEHQILIYGIICKKNDNTDSQVARFIVNGFTGILKGWCYNVSLELSIRKSSMLKKLHDHHNGMLIPYDQYTYSQLIKIIVDEGLALCNDLTLQYIMKK